MRLGVLLAAVAIMGAAVACGGDDDSTEASPTAFPTSSDPADRIPEDQRQELNLILASADVVVGPNNMAFALTGEDDEPVVAEDVEVTWYYRAPGAESYEAVMQSPAVRSEPGVGEEVVHVHADGTEHTHGGQDDNRVVYYANVTFENAGDWGMLANATVDGDPATANVGFVVQEDSGLLMPGDEAYPSDNLTKDDVDDIREIDSGTVPNDMHDLTIRESIEAGRPVMIVFSTPAFCQTRFCGPVTDEVAEMQDDYKDEVDFIHIEIWRDFDNQVVNSTALEWLQREDGSLTEPWVYLVDKNGVVYDRWEGAMDRTVMEPALKEVAEGAVYGSGD